MQSRHAVTPRSSSAASGVVDLSHTITADMPLLPQFPRPVLRVLSRADGKGVPAVSQFSACTHTGTHVDSPAHFIPDGKRLEDLAIERFILEGVVWDVGMNSAGPISWRQLSRARPSCRPG